MSQPEHDVPNFAAWLELPAGTGYAGIREWSRIGDCDADRRWSALADLYLATDTLHREQIRAYFADRRKDLDEMWIFVRRMGLLLKSKGDVGWLERGLAVAAVEGGRTDYRDTLVSLVLLRHGAERVGIDVAPFYLRFQHADYTALETIPLFENACEHKPQDVLDLVQHFGPPEWRGARH